MADYDDPLTAARKRNVPTLIGSSYFPAVDEMIRGGALSQGWSNRELLGHTGTRYLQGGTGLVPSNTYSPTMFDPNYRPEISPRTGQGLLTPMYFNPTPRSFFPGVRFPDGSSYRPKLAQNDNRDLLRDIDATFYGGGHAQPTPTPTPTSTPRSYFAGASPNMFDEWQKRYGFNV